MACGATLKRSMEFEALLSPQSPKRRRCNPLPGTPSTPSPQRCNLRPPVDSPTHSMSPSAIGGEHRLTPGMELRRIFSFSLRLGWVLWGRGVGWSGMDSLLVENQNGGWRLNLSLDKLTYERILTRNMFTIGHN